MADEAVLIFETALPIPFTVADNAAIAKGALLKLTDPMTAIISTGADDVMAGIAAEAKIANDGVTKLAVYRQGVFRILAGGAIALGENVKSNASVKSNEVLKVTPATNAVENVLGTCLETVSDTDTFLMELNIHQITDPA